MEERDWERRNVGFSGLPLSSPHSFVGGEEENLRNPRKLLCTAALRIFTDIGPQRSEL
jgi:hypothetical protein